MKNIGVFFGSSSPEHDISIVTAELIIATLKKMDYLVTPVYLTKDRRWLIGEEFGELKYFIQTKGEVSEKSKQNEYLLQLDGAKGRLVFMKKGLVPKKIEIDVAFPAFHGSYGEDGKMQGLFEMLGVPYVGCDVASSALTMDKALTKMIYNQGEILTTKFVSFSKDEWLDGKEDIIKRAKSELKWPVFVKPTHLGSSIGIKKVENMNNDDLLDAVEVGMFYDDKVLIEEAVEDMADLTCCVIGHGEIEASMVQESVFQSEMFSFDEKYLKDGGAQLGKAEGGILIPANVDKELTEKIQEMSKKIYRLFGCSGIARVDYLYDRKTRQIFANEINTLPGTLYHHLWKKSGIEIDELIEKLIGFAMERQNSSKQLTYSFKSNIFEHLGSCKLMVGKLNNKN